jgi:hypothetical protein
MNAPKRVPSGPRKSADFARKYQIGLSMFLPLHLLTFARAPLDPSIVEDAVTTRPPAKRSGQGLDWRPVHGRPIPFFPRFTQ